MFPGPRCSGQKRNLSALIEEDDLISADNFTFNSSDSSRQNYNRTEFIFIDQKKIAALAPGSQFNEGSSKIKKIIIKI